MPNPTPTRSPWAFVPLLYFMQAVPVSLVQDVSSIVYKDLGLPNETITRWTSLVALPWSLQLLLGPVVDLSGTKRRWVVGGQAAITAALALLPFALHTPQAFELSLAVLFVAALFSTLCNVATDGFYLMALGKDAQARFAGVITTFSRLGTLACKGLLVFIAGRMANQGMDQMMAWFSVLLAAAALYGLSFLINRFTLPYPSVDLPTDSEEGAWPNIRRTLLVVGLAVSGYFCLSGSWRALAHGLSFLFHLDGWRLKETANVVTWTVPFLNGVQVELVQAVLCGVIALWLALRVRRELTSTPMGDAFVSYFRQPGIVAIFAFLMFYRFGEAMVAKMSPLFLKDAVVHGGMALSNEQLGAIKGVIGVFGIILGGLAGGWVVGKLGLRKAFWPIAILMHLPNLLYLFAAYQGVHLPLALVDLGPLRGLSLTLGGIDFVEQFGYGFGYAGYMVYQMQVAQRGSYRTTHYAMGVGIGALFIQVAGVLSGVLQANLGYVGFFAVAVVLAIPGLLTLRWIPLDGASTGGQLVVDR